MVLTEVGKDEFKADFEDDERNDEGDISFDVDFEDKIDDDRGEHGDRDKHVVHSFGARGEKDFGFMRSSLFFKIEGESEFEGDANDKND